MGKVDPKTYKRYNQMAEEHANFLCWKVFKPAFMMGFLHGAKHMHDEMIEKNQGDNKRKPVPDGNQTNYSS